MIVADVVEDAGHAAVGQRHANDSVVPNVLRRGTSVTLAGRIGGRRLYDYRVARVRLNPEDMSRARLEGKGWVVVYPIHQESVGVIRGSNCVRSLGCRFACGSHGQKHAQARDYEQVVPFSHCRQEMRELVACLFSL